MVALSALFAAPVAACGSKTPSAKEPSTAPQEEETSSDEDLSADEAALLAQIEASADIADMQAEDATTAPSDEWDDTNGQQEQQREVVYRMSNDGLSIEVMGAEFVPRAKSIRVGKGYGVQLTVTASTSQPLVLYAPVQGPLAFGGRVQRAEEERFGDSRQGGTAVSFDPGSPIQFERSWPGDGQKPLMPGEELELHVGLWGLGTSDSDRRPVHRFLVVKMMASANGAVPRIEPPAN